MTKNYIVTYRQRTHRFGLMWEAECEGTSIRAHAGSVDAARESIMSRLHIMREPSEVISFRERFIVGDPQ